MNYDDIGRDWVARFLSHHPDLASARRKCIDAARIKDVSPEGLMKWFDDLESVIEEHNIEPRNVYNIDESGFTISDLHNISLMLLFVNSFKQNPVIRNR